MQMKFQIERMFVTKDRTGRREDVKRDKGNKREQVRSKRRQKNKSRDNWGA